jgi:hypothetical protein
MSGASGRSNIDGERRLFGRRFFCAGAQGGATVPTHAAPSSSSRGSRHHAPSSVRASRCRAETPAQNADKRFRSSLSNHEAPCGHRRESFAVRLTRHRGKTGVVLSGQALRQVAKPATPAVRSIGHAATRVAVDDSQRRHRRVAINVI